jgi:hypothetical protein
VYPVRIARTLPRGMVSDLDVVFRANPFVALDQLKGFDVVSWMESTPIQANGGLNFVRGWDGAGGGRGGQSGDDGGGGGDGDRGGDGDGDGRVGGHKVGQYSLNPVDPQLESRLVSTLEPIKK